MRLPEHVDIPELHSKYAHRAFLPLCVLVTRSDIVTGFVSVETLSVVHQVCSQTQISLSSTLLAS